MGGAVESDAARFRAIYEANYSRVLGYAVRRSPTAEDAADVVAETFLVAWRRVDEVPDPSGDGDRAWLYGVARRVLANQRRGDRRRQRLATSAMADAARAMALSTRPAWDADLADVATALAALGDDDREVLRLTAWEDLDARGLGLALECSPTAARVRLHRARGRLKRALPQQQSTPAFETEVVPSPQADLEVLDG